MNTDIRELLDQYKALWQSYLTSSQAEGIKRQLIETMEQIRDHAELPDEEWEEFTSTLPGFDEWWMRVRGEYLSYLDKCAARMAQETEE